MSLSDWNEYTGNKWLKALDVLDNNQGFRVVDVNESEDDQRPILNLQNEDIKAMFSLNVTNSIKCAEFVETPEKLIGKKIFFDKIKTQNPQTHKTVDALRVCKVE